MASSVETLIRGAVTKGVMKVAEFNRNRMKDDGKPHPYLSGIHEPISASGRTRLPQIPLDTTGS